MRNACVNCKNRWELVIGPTQNRLQQANDKKGRAKIYNAYAVFWYFFQKILITI